MKLSGTITKLYLDDTEVKATGVFPVSVNGQPIDLWLDFTVGNYQKIGDRVEVEMVAG